jgi:hypothetical protein
MYRENSALTPDTKYESTQTHRWFGVCEGSIAKCAVNVVAVSICVRKQTGHI